VSAGKCQDFVGKGKKKKKRGRKRTKERGRRDKMFQIGVGPQAVLSQKSKNLLLK
jgi:hypothetical protein